jgi:hypothetical protein
MEKIFNAMDRHPGKTIATVVAINIGMFLGACRGDRTRGSLRSHRTHRLMQVLARHSVACLCGHRHGAHYQDLMSMSSLIDRTWFPRCPWARSFAAMEHCLAEARRAWYSDSKPYPATTEYVRKIAGLSVKAMEQFGVRFVGTCG